MEPIECLGKGKLINYCVYFLHIALLGAWLYARSMFYLNPSTPLFDSDDANKSKLNKNKNWTTRYPFDTLDH